MWLNIDLIIVFLFLIANLIVGFGIYKKTSDTDDFRTYSLGNFKNISALFLTASISSSFVGGGHFIYLLQQSYHTGLSVIIRESLIVPLSFVITASFVFLMQKNTKRWCLTLDEWVDEKYHSSFLRALIGIAEFLFFFGIMIGQLNTFGIIFKVLFDLPPQYEKFCIIGFAVFLSLYTFKRGFIAVALTDILQFWVFAIAIIGLIIFIVFKTNFFAGVWNKGIIENPKMSLTPCFKDYNTTIFTLGIWFTTIFPKLNGPRYQRIMACDDSKKIKKSLWGTAGVLSFLAVFCAFVSLFIYSKNPNLTISEIMPFFVNNYCPVGLKGLLGAGLLAMSISTVESFLNCNSVVFTNDIMPFFYKIFNKKTYAPSVLIAKVATVFFCYLGVYIALQFTDIFTIFLIFSNFYYPVALIPYIILVLGLNIKKTSIITGIFCGIFATFVNYVLTKDINSYFVGLITHLIALLLTELFLRMRNKNDDKDTVTSKV